MSDERKTRRRKDLGTLHDLLLRAAPAGKEGKLPSIPTLAQALGIDKWAIYVWIQNGRVPARRVVRIVEIAEGRVTKEDFLPYTLV